MASKATSTWETIKRLAGRLGSNIAERALVAYFVATDPLTPPRHRAVLFSALAYLGLPTDAIADPTPVLGFTDDLAMLIAALIAVAVSVRVRHIRAARAAMRSFGMKPPDVDDRLRDDEGWEFV